MLLLCQSHTDLISRTSCLIYVLLQQINIILCSFCRHSIHHNCSYYTVQAIIIKMFTVHVSLKIIFIVIFQMNLLPMSPFQPERKVKKKKKRTFVQQNIGLLFLRRLVKPTYVVFTQDSDSFKCFLRYSNLRLLKRTSAHVSADMFVQKKGFCVDY